MMMTVVKRNLIGCHDVVGGSTAVVIGGTIAYSNFDPKFRASVEKNVPLSNKLLNAVLGPASLQSLSASTPEASSAVKDKAIESGLMKKRLERESKADASSLPNDPKSSTQQSSTSKTTASGIVPTYSSLIVDKHFKI